MKKAFKVLGYLVPGIILLLTAALTYVKLALPNVGDAPELTFSQHKQKSPGESI